MSLTVASCFLDLIIPVLTEVGRRGSKKAVLPGGQGEGRRSSC
jgi:hypothetical protein